MPTITITPDFFRQEVRNYADASRALWRELLQNAIDAGATRIAIELIALDAERAEVRFRDNGCGMSRETLENVFFQLGKTTKTGADTIGGFGKARILLCYAQEAYSIRTQNVIVQGQGADYEMEEIEENVRGCAFGLRVPLSEFGGSFSHLEEALYAYLSLCQVEAQITVNGKPWRAFTRRNQLSRRLSFGEVYTNKRGVNRLANTLLVRVNGVLMFEKYLHDSEAQVVLEIAPEKSRDVLLSNRDSLHWKYERELDKFCQELATDSISALKSERTIKEILSGAHREWRPRKCRTGGKRGKRQIEAIAKIEAIETFRSHREAVPASRPVHATHVKIEPGGMRSVGSAFSAPDSPEAREALAHTLGCAMEEIAYVETVEIVPERDPITEGFVFVNKATEPRIRRVAPLYHPDKWGEGKGTRRRKLLAQWIIACEAALDALYQVQPGFDYIGWRVGFCLADDEEALHEVQQDGTHALLLNPVYTPESREVERDEDVGLMRFGIRDFGSHVALLTLACHEVTHIVHDWHNEEFATAFTDITLVAFRDIQDIHMAMLSAG